MKKVLLFSILLFLSSVAIFAQSSTTGSASKKTETTVKGTVEDSEAAEIAQAAMTRSVQVAIASADYMVTPGDIYTIAYASGSTPVTYDTVVDSSYKIRVANLAVLDTKGKTYVELKKIVEDLVARNYPMSGVQFILKNPSEFKVMIQGEVKQPKEITAWALSRLDTIVAKNATNYTSRRSITIKSADGKTKDYDLFRATHFGEFDQNPYLKPNDTIIFKKIERRVNVTGAVRRPGNYELQKGENLKELIEIYSDGLNEWADTRMIQITRITDSDTLTGQNIYLSWEEGLSFELKPFDKVQIKSVADMRPVMYMEGAILANKEDSTKSEGTIEGASKVAIQFDYDTDYNFLIRNNRSKFDTPLADLSESYISRNGEIIPIDVGKVLYDPNNYSELKVQPGDVLTIPIRQFFVSVAGSVASPGRYPYIPNKTYEYYIGLAGGFDKSRNSGDSVTIRDFDGEKLPKNAEITPETIITANTNSFLYYFNQYAPVITTILTIISTTISVYFASKQLGL